MEVAALAWPLDLGFRLDRFSLRREANVKQPSGGPLPGQRKEAGLLQPALLAAQRPLLAPPLPHRDIRFRLAELLPSPAAGGGGHSLQ